LKIQALFIVIFLFFEIIGYFYIVTIRDREIEQILQNNINQNRILHDSLIGSFQTRADMIFDSIKDDSIFILSKAQHGKNEDFLREELKEKFFEKYQYLNWRYGVAQFHFHTADGRSLFRFHKPKLYGDSMISFRESIKLLHKEKRVVRGFETGRLYNAHRNIYPIFNGKELIGSVEINFAFNFILETAHNILPNSYDVIIYDENRILDSTNCDENYKKTLISDRFYNEQNFGTICANSSDLADKQNEHLKNVNLLIKDRVKEDLLKFNKFAIYQTYEESYTALSFIPIISISNKGSAYFVTYEKNNKDIEDQFILMRSRILILTFSLAVIFSLFYLFISKELEIRNLNRELRKKVREEIAKNRKKDRILLQQSKLSAMAEMINSIAHHWRQPLNRISLELLNIEEDFYYDELTENTLREHSNAVNQSLQYLSRIIDDFREFYKPPKEQEQTDIARIIRRSIDNFSMEDHMKIDFRNYLQERYMISYCDEFQQVIVNLIANSVDAIKNSRIKSGLIVISAYTESNSRTIVSIKDNGGGIPQKVAERIFEPYFTTKENEEDATGMGLYVSKIIVETNMDGTLSYVPHEKGTEFKIELT
jgi:signal transduction histidine kinase